MACGLVAVWFHVFTMPYRGERILLSYPLLDFDKFKNAEHKLSRRQAERVQRLLLHARIDANYQTWGGALTAVHGLVFPGYGTKALTRTAPQGPKMFLVCVEVPEAGKDRCFLFGETKVEIQLIDDFITDPLIANFEPAGRTAVYRDRNGGELPVRRDFR